MEQVLIVAHLLVVAAMIVVILLQRSEGGALGIGGGAGGLMSVRGSANLLTRTTIILGALFFATSIALTILPQVNPGSASIIDQAAEQMPDNMTVLDALSQMQGDTPAEEDAAPAETTPLSAEPAPAAPDAEAPAETPAEDGAPAAPVSR